MNRVDHIVSNVYNEDCLIGMKRFPDNYFDWAICDIEYNIGASKPSEKPHKVKQRNGAILNVKKANYEHSDWDFRLSPPEYFEELFRISKNQIIFGGNYYGLSGGYLVWDKLNGTTDQFGCELAWLSFTKRTDIVYYMWRGMFQGMHASKDVLKALQQQGNKSLNEKRIHETQKPVKLYDWILNEYKIKKMRVIDTHLGSGSNRIANHMHENEFHGFELSKKKFDDQENRFNDYMKQPKLIFPE